MPVNGVDSDRNYSSIINGGGTSGKVYNAVFSDDDSSDLSVNDFFEHDDNSAYESGFYESG